MLRRKFLLAVRTAVNSLRVVATIFLKRKIDLGSGPAKDVSVVKMENVRRLGDIDSFHARDVNVESVTQATVNSDLNAANAQTVTVESTIKLYRFSGLVGYGIGRLHVLRKFVVNATRILSRATAVPMGVWRKISVARSIEATSGIADMMAVDATETIARVQDISTADGVDLATGWIMPSDLSGQSAANGVPIAVEGIVQTRSTADLVCWVYPVLTDETLYIPAAQSVTQTGNRLIIT